MSTGDRATTAGELLGRAFVDFTAIDELDPALVPRDLDEANAIQVAMVEAVGDHVAGYKVGGEPGPMVGRVLARRCFDSPATLPAAMAAHRPHVECEVGFRLQSDLPVRDAAYERDEVASAATLVFTIELVGSRYVDGPVVPPDEPGRRLIIADNCAGTGLVVGPEVSDWRGLALLDIPVELRIDGGAPLPVNPLEARHDPFDTLLWLANELSRRQLGLEAGQLVTTGSATVPQPLAPGATARARFGEYGLIEVSLPA